MTTKRQNLVTCQICKKQYKMSEALPAELIRRPIVGIIQKTHPDWSSKGFICLSDLDHFRSAYVQNVIEEDKGELTSLEEQVVKSLQEREILAENINDEYDKNLTFSDRLSDNIAAFGGSWRFIILFGVILFSWVALNSITFLWKPYDPYPYIFLNLILSCLAAIQAPIIMMSQNRQESKDRLRAEHDYRVNLKAEIEIRSLHEKLDHLLVNQWQRLLEIQGVQMELMEELTHNKARTD